MNFNGPEGQQKCKAYIKTNKDRPFFGNKEFEKRKNEMDTFVKK